MKLFKDALMLSFQPEAQTKHTSARAWASRLLVQFFALLLMLVGPAQSFAQSTASGSESTTKSPAFAYVVASLSALLIMLILCMPSRKR